MNKNQFRQGDGGGYYTSYSRASGMNIPRWKVIKQNRVWRVFTPHGPPHDMRYEQYGSDHKTFRAAVESIEVRT